MWIILLGFAVTTMVALVEVATGEKPRPIKALLVGLALAGFAIGTFSTVKEDGEKIKAAADRRIAIERLNELKLTLGLVNATVGDLGTLNAMSSGTKYYVRVSRGKTRPELQHFLGVLEQRFPGATANKAACILPTKDGRYDLVLGRHLNLAAAEVFARLVDGSHLQPANQFAWIEPDSLPDCG